MIVETTKATASQGETLDDAQVLSSDLPAVQDFNNRHAFGRIALYGTLNAIQQSLQLGRIAAAKQLGGAGAELSQQEVADMLNPSPLGNSVINLTNVYNPAPQSQESTPVVEPVSPQPVRQQTPPAPEVVDPAPTVKPVIKPPDISESELVLPPVIPVKPIVETPVVQQPVIQPPKPVTDSPTPPPPTGSNGLKTLISAGIASLLGAGLVLGGMAMKPESGPKLYEGVIEVKVPLQKRVGTRNTRQGSTTEETGAAQSRSRESTQQNSEQPQLPTPDTSQ